MEIRPTQSSPAFDTAGAGLPVSNLEFRQLLSTVCEILGCQRVALVEIVTDENRFLVKDHYGSISTPADFWSGILTELLKSDAIHEQVLSRGTIFYTNEVNQVFTGITIPVDFSSLLFIPFRNDKSVTGLLACTWLNESHRFTPAEMAGVRLLADYIQLLIRTGTNAQELAKKNQRLAALLELATTVYSSLNYRVVLEKVLNLATRLVRANCCHIFTYDREAQLLTPLMTNREEYREQIMSFTLKLGEGLSGRVVQAGVGLIANHAELNANVAQIPGTPMEKESLISVPLFYSGEVIGVLTLSALGEEREFDQEDLEILTIFARQAADVLENARLYESLEQAYQRLFTAQEQMVQIERLRALGEMAGGVAHDFNNMLGAILGRVQLLQLQTDDKRLLAGLQQIEQLTQEGARTVTRIQEFTRVRTDSSFAPLDLRQVVQEAIEITKPRWRDQAQQEGKLINIETEFAQIPPVSGNATELVDVVTNMISNAVDAMPNGGCLRFRLSSNNQNQVVLKVADNGQGMSPEIQHKIFFPFFTTKGVKSTGLGLSVVYGTISRHKGTITVESREGQGTTFTITLPVCKLTEQERPQALCPPIGTTLRVLMIDDDENIREIFQDMLSLDGHNIRTAGGGVEALALFDREPFDVVITDLGMPGMSGWDIARAVKERNPCTPVILVTGWGAQVKEGEVKKRGVDLVITKPFQLEQIRQALAYVTVATAGESAIPTESKSATEAFVKQ